MNFSKVIATAALIVAAAAAPAPTTSEPSYPTETAIMT